MATPRKDFLSKFIFALPHKSGTVRRDSKSLFIREMWADKLPASDISEEGEKYLKKPVAGENAPQRPAASDCRKQNKKEREICAGSHALDHR